MSSDDDAEELAALRAARAARTGGAATLSQLRELQKRADGASGDYFEGAPPRSGAGTSAARRPGDAGREPEPKEGDDEQDDQEDGPSIEPGAGGSPSAAAAGPSGSAAAAAAAAGKGGKGGRKVVVEWTEEPQRMDDPLRAHLPLSFGTQEVRVENPTKVHSQFQRPGAGPGSTSGSGSRAFGPPRPPPKGRSGGDGDGGGAGPSGGSGAAFGPPRPPPRRGGEGAEGGAEEVGPPRPPPEEGDAEGEGDVGPPRPPQGDSEEEGDGDDDGGGADLMAGADEEEEEEDDPYGLPITHEAVLGGHTKAVSCLAVEHTGTRLASGSYDYTVRLYDFHGMKSDMRSFRDFEPSDGHPVFSVSWSPSGESLLVVTGSAQAKIYDRDGREKGEFVRGDMYIRDARNTKGHVSGLTAGAWHPIDRFTAMTSSEDGTVRIWDTHHLRQKTVIKPTLARPVRTAVSTTAYNGNGTLIGAGLADGTVQVWSVGGKFGVSAAVGQVLPPPLQMVEKQGWSYVSKPNQLIRDAHEAGSEISGLAFGSDGHTLLSRGTDGTLKIWDLRRFSVPVHAHANLPCAYAQTKVMFSPDESLIVTGTSGAGSSAGEGGTEGAVVFFSRAKHELIRKVGMPGSVTGLAWHPRLNQLFVGVGNRRAGATHALYDLVRSERGVVGAASRRPRPPNPLDFTPPVLIKTPHALPMYREDPTKKRKAEKEARAARRPDLGMVAGRGKQGRLGATGGTLLTQHLLKQRGGLMAPEHEADPREAILRHADKAKEEFGAWTAAYRATQPKPLYAQEEAEEDEEA